jgi:hypothetical protein
LTYARRDGADDAELIAQILAAFGRKDLACLLYRILDVLNTGVFLGAIIGVLNGLITLVKGIKLLRTLKKATIPGLLELIVPSKYLGSLGAFYVWTGAFTAGASALIVFLSAIQNSVAVYLLAKSACETTVEPFDIENEPLHLGDLPGALVTALTLLRQAEDQAK